REDRRLAGQVVDAGPQRRSDHEHVEAAQMAEADVEIEVGEHAANLRAQVSLDVGGLHPGNAEAAHLRQIDLPVAVDGGAVVDVDGSPGADDQLVAGPDDVVGRDRHVV